MTIPATKMCSYFANTWRSLLREEAVRAEALRRSSRVAEVSEHLCVRCPTSREQISGATRKLARLSTLVGLQALLLSLRGLTEGIISSWKNGREILYAPSQGRGQTSAYTRKGTGCILDD